MKFNQMAEKIKNMKLSILEARKEAKEAKEAKDENPDPETTLPPGVE